MSVDLLALQSMIDEQIRNSGLAINVRQLQGKRRGVATATITNATDAVVTFPHGLGRVPEWVSLTASWGSVAGRDDFFASFGSADATNLTVSVRAAAAEQFGVFIPTTVSVYWEAA